MMNGEPLTEKETQELDNFLLEATGIEEAMDIATLDGFLTAIVSGRNVIPPGEWMRWVWDMERGRTRPAGVATADRRQAALDVDHPALRNGRRLGSAQAEEALPWCRGSLLERHLGEGHQLDSVLLDRRTHGAHHAHAGGLVAVAAERVNARREFFSAFADERPLLDE